MLKVWDMDKADRETSGFKCILNKDLFESLPLTRSTVTCITAAEDLSAILVGLHSGSVVVVQGDIQVSSREFRV